MPNNPIVISSGHGKYIRGASGNPVPPQLDEVDAARRVVDRVYDILQGAGVTVYKFHDNTSHDQNTNLHTIVNYHNSKSRDLDVSVHFNCYDHSAHGTECLYITQETLSAKVSSRLAADGHFTNRGAKYRSDLYFLNSTHEPAILIETCFCDNTGDCNNFNKYFEAICHGIAETIYGAPLDESPEPPEPIEPPPTEPPTQQPAIGTVRGVPVGDRLNIRSAASGSADVIGTCGNGSQLKIVGGSGGWLKIEFGAGVLVYGYASAEYVELEGSVPTGLPPPLTAQQQNAITGIAASSPIARYYWQDRGVAPDGYTKGFALAFANAHLQLRYGYGPAVDMAQADTGNDDKDVLAWYAGEFADADMDNSRDGPDTLRHLWALMMGLGMRESSGQHCCGRDQSASNTTSDTAEAGLFQTSYNARSSSSEFTRLMDDYSADLIQGFLETFRQEVSCSSSDWQNYGSGDGAKFQDMCKNLPAFACETCAIVLRHLRQHYGPINRYEVELLTEADEMLKEVQDYIDSQQLVA